MKRVLDRYDIDCQPSLLFVVASTTLVWKRNFPRFCRFRGCLINPLIDQCSPTRLFSLNLFKYSTIAWLFHLPIHRWKGEKESRQGYNRHQEMQNVVLTNKTFRKSKERVLSISLSLSLSLCASFSLFVCLYVGMSLLFFNSLRRAFHNRKKQSNRDSSIINDPHEAKRKKKRKKRKKSKSSTIHQFNLISTP